MLSDWSASIVFLTILNIKTPLTAHSCLMQNQRKFRLMGQLTMRIECVCNKVLKKYLFSTPLWFNVLIMSLLTFNYHTIPILLPNPNYEIEASILFYFIALLSIWHLMPKTSKTLLTLLLSISATNKLTQRNLTTFRILKMLVRQSRISFSQFIN